MKIFRTIAALTLLSAGMPLAGHDSIATVVADPLAWAQLTFGSDSPRGTESLTMVKDTE